MNAKSKSPAPAQNEHILNYHGTDIAFEEINGNIMVNATQMSKPFGKSKKPDNWLRTKQASELIQAVAVSQICDLDDLKEVRWGGRNQGTWFQEDVALFFAQWLSPEFYLACNTKLKELLKEDSKKMKPFNGVWPLIVDNRPHFYYIEALSSLGFSTKSGSASRRKRQYPQHFVKNFGRNFITLEFFKFLKASSEVRQLQLNLSN